MSDLATNMLQRQAVRTGTLRPAESVGLRLERDTFVKQREFILADERRLVLCTPRRAAKTESLLRKWLRNLLLVPQSTWVYVSMTRDVAKRNTWDRLMHLNDRYQLGLQFNHSALTVKYPPTGSQMWVTGVATKAELAKLRGNKYDGVAIDEQQDVLIDMEEFLLSVVMPALGDRRGQLIMAGTPDPFRRQPMWYQANKSEHPQWARWRRMGWLLTDNIFFQDAEGYLRDVREKEGYAEDDPRYQAEYLGLWTASKTNLCIDGYDPGRNDLLIRAQDVGARFPEYHYVLGLDPGYKDSTAFVVAAYSSIKRHVLFVESFAKKNMIVSEMAAECLALLGKYPITTIACDEAKMGKTVAMELTQRYSLPVIAAEKKDKRMRLAFMNSDLRTGRLQVVRAGNAELIEQWGAVLWDKDHQREAEGQECDLFDASGYAHMACRSFWEEPEAAIGADEGSQYWERMEEEAKQRNAPDPYDWSEREIP